MSTKSVFLQRPGNQLGSKTLEKYGIGIKNEMFYSYQCPAVPSGGGAIVVVVVGCYPCRSSDGPGLLEEELEKEVLS